MIVDAPVGNNPRKGISMSDPTDAEVRDTVRRRYAARALAVLDCGATACCTGADAGGNPVSTGLYTLAQTALLPAEAVQASLGCGNPTALAELRPGEVVL